MVEGIERDVRKAGRERQASTSASSPAQIRETSLLLKVGDPKGTDELLHPARADPADVGLLDDRKERPLGPSARLEQALGKYVPSRSLGICRSIVPTRVSERRSRYPLRWVRRRSGTRSPWVAPIWADTSTSMTSNVWKFREG